MNMRFWVLVLLHCLLYFDDGSADLIGAWSGGSLQDSSQHGNDLSATGSGYTATSTDAPLGVSYAAFSGTAYTLQKASFDPQESGFFTLEFWVRSTDCCAEIFNYDDTVISLYIGSTAPRSYGILTLAGTTTYGPSGKLIGADMFDGSWHHASIVRKFGTVEWYLDSILYGQVSTGVTSAIGSGACLSVAAPACVGGSSDRYLTGDLAELRFWNEARSSTQIRESMFSIATAATSNGNCPTGYTLDVPGLSTDGLTSLPTLWLDAQDAALVNATASNRVNRWQDKSTASNDVIQEDSAVQPLFQADGLGSGLNSILFDPDEGTPATLISYTGSYRGLYCSAFPEAQDMTIFALIKPSYEHGSIISQAYRFTSTEMGWMWYRGSIFFGSYQQTDSVLWSSHDDSSNANAATIVQASSGASPQTVQVMSVRKSGSSISLSVNGTEVASGTISASAISYSSAVRRDLLVGLPASQGDSDARYATHAFHGHMGELLFFDYAMGAEERAVVDNYLSDHWLNRRVCLQGTTPSCAAGTYRAGGACAACPSDSDSPAGSQSVRNCTCNSGYFGSPGGPCYAVSVQGGGNAPSAGGGTLSLTAGGFDNGPSFAARVGGSGSALTTWVSQTSVTCQVQRGARGSLAVALTSSDGGLAAFIRSGSQVAAASFDAAAPTALAAVNAVPTGGQPLTVTGSGLGVDQYSVRARVPETGCARSEWVAATSLQCRVSAGAHGSLSAVVTVHGAAGSATEVASFDAQAMSSLAPVNLPSESSRSVTLVGVRLGGAVWSESMAARAGETGCAATAWVSETAAVCRQGSGLGASLYAVVTAGGSGNSLSAAISYLAGSLSSARGTNSDVGGSDSVSMRGTSLGSWMRSSTVRVGESACGASAWVSGSSVRCHAARGAGSSLRTIVTAGAATSSLTQALSLDNPTVSTATSNRQAASASSVTIHGSGFGEASDSAIAREGETRSEVSSWISLSSVACKASDAGRHSISAVVSAGNRGAGTVTEAASFDSSVISATRTVNGPEAGGATVSLTMTGTAFHVQDASSRSTLGDTNCEASGWRSSTALLCRSGAGRAGSLGGIVTVQGLAGSLSHAISYDGGPEASSIQRANAATSGGNEVQVHGVELGSMQHSSAGRGGATGHEETAWISDTSSRCKIARGAGQSMAVAVTSGARTETTTALTSFDEPRASAVTRVNANVLGGVEFTISGSTLGGRQRSLAATLGATGCESTVWLSESAVSCTGASGRGTSHGAVVTAAGGVVSATGALSFDASSLSSTAPSNTPLGALHTLVLAGTDFGSNSNSAEGARAGSTACDMTVWLSVTSIQCVSAPFRGRSLAAIVTVGQRILSMTATFSSDGPQVTEMNVGDVNVRPGDANLVALWASGFGPHWGSVAGALGDTTCERSVWVSDSAIACRWSQAVGKSLQAVVTSGSTSGSLTEAVSSDAPSLSAVMERNGVSNAAFWVSVAGSNFALRPASLAVSTGSSTCESVTWTSDTAIVGLFSANTMLRSLKSLVTVGGQVGTLTQASSLDLAPLSSLSESNIPSTGMVVTLLADHISARQCSMATSLGETACEQTTWVADSSVLCSAAAAGGRATMGALLTASTRTSSQTSVGSYDAAEATAAGPSNSATWTQLTLTIFGSHMAVFDVSPHSFLGFTDDEKSVWASDTSLTCIHAGGESRSRAAVVTASSRTQTLSETVSYDVWAAVDATFGAVNGISSELTISAHGFGIVLATQSASVGETACEGTDWTSDTSMSCRSASGALQTLHAVVTVTTQAGTISQALSYDAFAATAARIANGFSSSHSLTLTGLRLEIYALSTSAAISDTGCERTDWVSETSLSCKSNVRSSRTMSAVVTSGQRTSTLSQTVSFDSVLPSGMADANAPPLSSYTFTAPSRGASLWDLSAAVRLSGTSASRSHWVSETAVLATGVPVSRQGSSGMTITASQSSGTLTAAWTVDSVHVSSRYPANLAFTTPDITIFSANLGEALATPNAKSQITACEATRWSSTTSLRCTGPGKGMRSEISIVTVGSRVGSLTAAGSYDVVRVSGISVVNGIVDQGVSVSVRSLGTINTDSTLRLRLGSSACERTFWTSDSSISSFCTAHAGSLRVAVTASSRDGTMTDVASHAGFLFSSIRGINLQCSDATLMTVSGDGFGISDRSIAGRMGGTSFQHTFWVSGSELSCKAGSGTRRSLPSTITAVGFVRSLTLAATYDGPLVLGSFNLAPTGSDITSNGACFGLRDASHASRSGHTASQSTAWVSETALACSIGRSTIQSLSASITAAGTVQTLSQSLSYDDQTLLGHRGFVGFALVSIANSALSGADSITITAQTQSFGEVARSVQLKTGDSACTRSEWISESQLLCNVRGGLMRSRLMAVTLGSTIGTKTTTISYDSPRPSTAVFANSAATGSVILHLVTGYLGTFESSLTSSVGSTACEQSAWVSTTSLRGTSSQGLASSLSAVVTAGQGTGTVSSTLSFNLPSLSSPAASNLAWSNPVVTILGGAYAASDWSVRSRPGGTNCQRTKWTSQSAVTCYLSAAHAASLMAVVTASGSVGTTSQVGSYDMLMVQNPSTFNIASTAVDSIVIRGSGIAAATLRVAVGQTQCLVTGWTSDSSLHCKVGESRTSCLSVRITGGLRVHTLTETLSFDGPTASVVSPLNTMMRGALTASSFGSNFGRRQDSLQGRLSESSCEFTAWTSNSALACKAGVGSRGSAAVIVTAGGYARSLSEIHSYDKPSVSSLQTGNSASALGESISIHGKWQVAAAVSSQSHVGDTSCEASSWVASSSLLCKVAQGSSKSLSVIVTSSLHAGTVSEGASYDAPVSSSIILVNGMTAATCCISVHGTGLSSYPTSLSSKSGETAAENSLWLSDTSLQATASSGFRMSQIVVITTGAGAGTLSQAYTHDAPVSSSVQGGNVRTKGGNTVSIHGASLGNSQSSISATHDGTACEMTLWASQSSVRCIVATGATATRAASVTAGEHASTLSELVSYNQPSVSSPTPQNMKRTSASVTSTGWSYCSQTRSVSSSIGATPCAATNWISDSSLQCKSALGSAQSKVFVVSAGSRVGTATDGISHDVAGLSQCSRSNGPGTGAFIITMHGMLIGSTAVSQQATIGNTVCDQSRWYSASAVTCKSSSGLVYTSAIAVTTHAYGSSLTQVLSYDTGITSRAHANIATSGQIAFEIPGASTSFMLTTDVRASGTACESSAWNSATSLHCKASAGLGASRSVTVSAGMTFQTSTDGISYSVPHNIAISDVSNHHRQQPQTLAVSAQGLGFWDHTVKLRLGGTHFSGSAWTSDTAVAGLRAAGIERSLGVTVTAGLRVSTASLLSTYDAAPLSNLAIDNAPQAGGDILILHPSSLGARQLSIGCVIGLTAAERSRWTSASSVVCQIGVGISSTLRAVVTAGWEASSISHVMTFDDAALSGSNVATVADIALVISHADLMMGASTPASRLGATGTMNTLWVSDTLVRCQSAKLGKGSLHASITVGDRVSTTSETVSYDVHSQPLPGEANVRQDGSHTFVLNSGTGLSSSPGGRLGGTGCSASSWVSTTAALCRVSAGTGSTSVVVLTSGIRTATTSEALTFDRAAMSSLSPSNVLGGAAELISVRAESGFGSRDTTVHAAVGGTLCESTMWASLTGIVCRLRDPGFQSMHLQLTSSGAIGTLSQAVSYDSEQISTLHTVNLLTPGVGSVTMSGAQFGVLAVTPKSSVGVSAVESTGWVSLSSVHCKAGQLLAGSLRAVLTVLATPGTVTHVVSHDAPAPHGGSNLAQSPSTLTIAGESLGFWDSTARGRTGSTACQRSSWESQTSMHCRHVDSGLGSHRLVLTVGKLAGSGSGSLSYDHGLVSSAALSNLLITSKPPLTVHGKGFGTNDATGKTRTGITDCHLTEWIASTSVLCTAAPSTSASARIILTVGRRSVSVTEVCTFDAPWTPRATNLVPGAKIVEVNGHSILALYTTSATIGMTPCESTLWVADSSILCAVARGKDGTLTLAVTSGLQGGSLSQTASYDAAHVSTMTPVNVGQSPSHARTLSLSGHRFGSRGHTSRISVQHTQAEATFWISTSMIVGNSGCSTGATAQIALTGGVRVITTSEMFSHDSPSVSSAADTNTPVSNSTVVTVRGSALGLSSGSLPARIGTTDSVWTRWVSESSLRCKGVVGFGQTHSLAVTTGKSTGSTSQALSYDSSLGIDSVVNARAYQMLPLDMAVYMGAWDHTAAIRLGSTACEESEWFSNTHVRCRAAPSTTSSRAPVVTAGTTAKSMTRSVSYDVAILSVASSSNMPDGQQSGVTVHGALIGRRESSASLSLGASSCQASNWISETSVLGRATPVLAQSSRLTLSVGTRTGSVTETITFDAWLWETTSVKNLPSQLSSDVQVSLSGQQQVVGTSGLSGKVHVGRTTCEATDWSSESSLQCRYATSTADTLRLIATLGVRVGTVTELLSFDAEPLYAVTNERYLSLQAHMIVGTELAMQSMGVRMGQSACEQSTWVSSSSVYCKVTNRVGGSGVAVVTSGVLKGSMTEVGSYGAGLSSGARVNWLTGGVEEIFVSGAGRTDWTGRTRSGGSSCGMTVWLADSAVSCRSVEMSFGTATLVLTATGPSSSLTESVSFDFLQWSMEGTANLPSKTNPGSVALSGSNLLQSSHTMQLRSGGSSCEHTAWVSPSSMRCRAMMSSGRSLQVIATVGSTTRTISELLSFDAEPLYAVTNERYLSLQAHMIVGTELAMQSMGVRMGQSACEQSTWVSSSSVYCKAANRVGGSGVAVVTSGILKGSMTEVGSYGAGLSSGARVNWLSKTSAQMFVSAARVDTSVRAAIGATGCLSTGWISTSHVVCHTFQRGRGTMSAAVTASSHVATLTEAASLDVASLRIRGDNIPQTGQLQALAASELSLIPGSSWSVRIGFSASISTTWTSSSSLACKYGSGMKRSQGVVLSAAWLRSSITTAMSYQSPAHSRTGTQNSVAGNEISSIGASFGLFDISSQSRMAASACERTVWQSATSSRSLTTTTAKSPSRSVSITAGSQVATRSELFSFDVDRVSSTSPGNLGSAGQMELLGVVSSIATSQVSLRANIGGSGCQQSVWISSTSIHCRHSQGAGSSHGIVVSAALCGFSLTAATTYDAPALSSITVHDAATDSASRGFAMTVSGNRFVDFDLTSSSRVGGSGCEASKWRSSSAITCIVPGGVDVVGLTVVLTAHVVASTLSTAFTYLSPSISTALPVNVPTIDSQSVTFFGSQFWAYAVSPAARLASTGCESTVWISGTSTHSFSPSGTTASQKIILTMVVFEATVSESATYDAPRPMLSSNARSISGQLLSGTGSGFGMVLLSQAVRIGVTSSEEVMWISTTSILCKAQLSTKTSSLVVVSVQSQTGSQTTAISFDRVTYLDFSANLPHGEQYAIPMLDANPGMPRSLGIRIGASPCERSRWASSSALLCRGSSGLGSTRPLTVTAGLSSSSATQGFSYSGAHLISASNSDPKLVVAFKTSGTSLAVSAWATVSARVGHSAVRVTEWVNDTMTTARVDRTTASSLRAAITFGSKSGTVSEVISFERLPPLAATLVSGVVVGSALYAIEVSGDGLGQATVRSHGGFTAAERTEWVSASMLQCRHHAVTRTSQAARLTAGVLVSSLSHCISYDFAISTVGLSNSPQTDVSTFETVYGEFFGTFGVSSAGRFGGTSAQPTIWIADTSMLVRPSPSSPNAQMSVVLTSGAGTASATGVVSSDRPAVGAVEITQSNLLQAGANHVALFGSNFGAATQGFPSVIVFVGGTIAHQSLWVSDSAATAISRPGAAETGLGVQLLASEDGRGHEVTAALSFDAVQLSSLSYLNAAPNSEASVLFSGSNFAEWSVTAQGQHGGTSCQQSVWISSTVLACAIASGQREFVERSAVLSVGSRFGSLSMAVSFDVVAASSIARTNVPGVGDSMAISGSNFGAVDASSRSRVVRSAQEDAAEPSPMSTASIMSAWVSESSMVCRTPAGVEGGRGILVSQALGTSSVSEAWSYNAEYLLHAVPSNAMFRAGVDLQVLAANLGSWDRSSKGRVGGTACENTEWISDSSMRCGMAYGHGFWGSTQAVAVTVANDVATAVVPFQFDGLRLYRLGESTPVTATLVLENVESVLTVHEEYALQAVLEEVLGTVDGVEDIVLVQVLVPARRSLQTFGEGDHVGDHVAANLEGEPQRRLLQTVTVVEAEVVGWVREYAKENFLAVLYRDSTSDALTAAVAGRGLNTSKISLKGFAGYYDAAGQVVPCCCDPGQCPCYVCLVPIEEAERPLVNFLPILGFITAGLLAACFGGVTVWKVGASALNKNRVYAVETEQAAPANRFFGTTREARLGGGEKTRQEAQLRDVGTVVMERRAMWAERHEQAPPSRATTAARREVDDVILSDVEDDVKELGRANQNDT